MSGEAVSKDKPPNTVAIIHSFIHSSVTGNMNEHNVSEPVAPALSLLFKYTHHACKSASLYSIYVEYNGPWNIMGPDLLLVPTGSVSLISPRIRCDCACWEILDLCRWIQMLEILKPLSGTQWSEAVLGSLVCWLFCIAYRLSDFKVTNLADTRHHRIIYWAFLLARIGGWAREQSTRLASSRAQIQCPVHRNAFSF